MQAESLFAVSLQITSWREKRQPGPSASLRGHAQKIN